MAKKTKIPAKTEKKTFTEVEVQAALEILHSEYFMQTIALLSHLEDAKDLKYVKVPVSTPDGGLYLVSILHVDGPTVSLKNLKEQAELQEAKKENPQPKSGVSKNQNVDPSIKTESSS